jgi:hypothetical protein
MGKGASGLDSTPCEGDNSRADDLWYKGPLKVYTRRKYKSQEEVPTIVTPTTHEHSSLDPQEVVDVSSTSETEIETLL